MRWKGLAKVLEAVLVWVPAQKAYYWNMRLECGHFKRRGAYGHYKTKAPGHSDCLQCKGLKPIDKNWKKKAERGRPGLTSHKSKLVVCGTCGFKSYKQKAMDVHMEVDHRLSNCACGTHRVRITIPVHVEPEKIEFFTAYYCHKCNNAIHISVVENDIKTLTVTRASNKICLEARRVYQGVLESLKNA